MNEVSTLLDDAAAYESMSKAVNPNGDGKHADALPISLQARKPTDIR